MPPTELEDGRERLLQIVHERPGASLSELASEMDISPSSVMWHARRLEKSGDLKSLKMRQHRIFYSTKDGVEGRRRAIEAFALKHETSAKILEAIRHHPGTTATLLARMLHEPVHQIRSALARLADAHLVESHRAGRAVHYHVATRRWLR